MGIIRLFKTRLCQEDEKRLDCRKRNLLYENICEIYNEDKKDGKKMKTFLKDGKGIHVGETS